MAEILRMYNRTLNATGDTTQLAFDTIYRFRDWEVMSPVAALATEIVGRPVIDLNDLTVNEARQVIAASGGEQPPTGATKDEVIRRLSGDSAGGAEPTEPVDLFDPAAHNRDEVLQYLSSASPEEVARVKAAEAGDGGKNRSTVIDWSPTGS